MKTKQYILYRRMRNTWYAWLECLLYVVERRMKKFITIHQRPAYASDIITQADCVTPYPKTAIVIQGPIVYDNDFTRQTVLLYKKRFPHDIIILSTWEDEDRAYLSSISGENVEIIFNKKPITAGVTNINFQITSTTAGIALARRHNALYIVKTRTDQRIYNAYALSLLYNLVRSFPLSPLAPNRGRLVVSSMSKKPPFALYHFSDMFMYAAREDMERYWNIEQREYLPSECKTAENYLVTAFLQNTGETLQWTPHDAIRIFATYTIVVDLCSLDWYWHKYERYVEYKNMKYDTRQISTVSFSEWLDWYWAYNAPHEKLADQS